MYRNISRDMNVCKNSTTAAGAGACAGAVGLVVWGGAEALAGAVALAERNLR